MNILMPPNILIARNYADAYFSNTMCKLRVWERMNEGNCRALKTSQSFWRSGENQAVGDEETLTKTKKFTTWRKSVKSKAVEETVYFDEMAAIGMNQL